MIKELTIEKNTYLNNWEEVALGQLCKLTRGHNPPKSKFIHEPRENYVRFYQIRDGWSDKHIVFVPNTPQLHKVEPTDMLMVAYRHIGRVFRGVEGAFNVALCKISNTSREKLDDDFLFYMIPTDIIKGELMKRSERSLIPSMSVNHLKEITIPLPPLTQQKQIVAILDKAFAAIDTAKANAEQNLQNAKELFESYLQNIFENKGDDWEEKKLSEIADVIDSLHRTPKYSIEGYPMVRVTDIKPGFLNLSKTKKVDKNTFDDFSKKHTPKIGDIVLSRVGSYGVSAIVNTTEPFCLGQNTVFLIPKINSNYFYHFLNSPYAKKQIDNMVSGSTQPTISLKSIRTIFVPLPNIKTQEILVKKIETISNATSKLEAIYTQKIADLEEMKKSVLQKAFSGQLNTIN